MLIQIIIVKKNVTICLQRWISTCSACFLNVIFKRIGYIVVDNKFNITFVNAHAKSRGCYNNRHLVIHKGFLIRNLIVGFHLSVVRKCFKSIARQLACKLKRTLGSRNIDNRRTIFLCNQSAKCIIFFFIGFFMQNRIMQIFSCCGRCKNFKIQIKFLLEIITNISNNLLLCRRGKTRHRNRLFIGFLFLLKLANEISDIEIIHSEILTPCRETVSFINYESHNISRHQKALYRFRTQLFGRDIKK